MPQFADHTGKRFGKLTAVRRTSEPGAGRTYWLCKCDCGTEKVVNASGLVQGTIRSCGCLRIEASSVNTLTHGAARGGTRTPEYVAWSNMQARCYVQTNKSYADYGGRGITVHQRWLDGDGTRGGFECFLGDIGPKPGPGYSIDRIRNNEGYGPGNCQWALRTRQSRNRRSTVMVEHDGHTVPLIDLCESLGLRHKLVIERYRKGWALERCLGQKSRRRAPLPIR
jgi:hypothetical protein